MSFPKIDLTDAAIPLGDGAVNDYVYREAAESEYFNPDRTVFFINGMLNKPEDHAEAALALSWVQMCRVKGIYNLSAGVWRDFFQCIGDKDQFNGPFSFAADTKLRVSQFLWGETPEFVARHALSRNRAQVAAFDELRRPSQRSFEIFAHSQGNLILSNALQAIAAVDGLGAISGRVVHTFGSPTVNWPPGITKYEHGFTFDPVNWLSGFDSTWSVSKLGLPRDSYQPITHAFLEYLDNDPAFVVNRFRWGGLGVTFKLDSFGLARCLVEMGTNFRRVENIFAYIGENHSYYSDDVSLAYVNLVKGRATLVALMAKDERLKRILIDLLGQGWVSAEEKQAIAYLNSL